VIRILLICPSIEMSIVRGYNPRMKECLGIAYLAGYLRQNGISVDILDANVETLTNEAILGRIGKKQYEIIGVSLIAFQVEDAVISLIRFLSERLEDKPLFVVGGSHATLAHKELLEKYPEINYVVRGEGEETFYQLVLEVNQGNFSPDILGVSYRDGNGKIHINDPRPLVEDLDSLPYPMRYNAEYIAKADRSIYIFSSRGCYGRCSFCGLRNFLPTWRARSVASVCNEIEYLMSRFEAKRFYFVDENFLGRCQRGYTRGLAFAEEVLRRRLNIRFIFMCRVDDIREPLFSKLAQAGLEQVSVGVESFSDNSLKFYNKQISKAQIMQACTILHSTKVRAYFGWIMFHPLVTIADLEENLKFMSDFSEFLEVRSFFSRLLIHPHTPIEEQLREMKILEEAQTVDGFRLLRYDFQDPDVRKVWNLLQSLRIKYVETEKAVRDINDYCLDKKAALANRGVFFAESAYLAKADDLTKRLYRLWHSLFISILKLAKEGRLHAFKEPTSFVYGQSEVKQIAKLTLEELNWISETGGFSCS